MTLLSLLHFTADPTRDPGRSIFSTSDRDPLTQQEPSIVSEAEACRFAGAPGKSRSQDSN